MRRNEDIFAPNPPKRRSFWWPWCRFILSWIAIIALIISAILWLSHLTGCVTSPEHGHVRRLMAFPGFEDAGRAAPGWTVEALETIAHLEGELNAARR